MSGSESLPLRQLQQSFFGHLTGSPGAIIEHVQSTADWSAEQRLHIYASGYRLRLKEAISTDFDCLFSYLGDEMFELLMDAYIDKYKSQHPSLRYYSQHMTELLSQQAPFSSYPELLEIAKIEQAFNFSFDAANCTTIGIQRIAQITAEDWEALRINFHASVQILPLKTNSLAIWKALSEEQAPPASIEQSTAWIIWRQDLVSLYRNLSEAESCVLNMAMDGANFSQLCVSMLEFVDEDQAAMQVMTFLQTWISEKMVCQLG